MRIACWMTKALSVHSVCDTAFPLRQRLYERVLMLRYMYSTLPVWFSIARADRDGTRAETRFRLSQKRTSPFKSVEASVQSTAGSRGVRISLSNAG